MFNKLFRKYNQNRKTLLTVIIFIAFFIILIQFFNNSIRKSKEENENQISNYVGINQNSNSENISSIIGNNSQANNIDHANSSNTSSSYNNVSSSVTKIVNTFVTYCNNNEIELAYNMLSTDCKKALYPNLDIFKNNYYNQVFTVKRSAKAEESIYGNQIYQVKYYADLLSTGGNTQETMQDYIYLTIENDETKLNINQFLYTDSNEKFTTNGQVSIKVIKKDVYIEYEKYQIQVTNNTENTIAISTNEIKNNIYIQDTYGVKHTSNVEEIARQNLEIEASKVSIIKLKFYRLYNVDNPVKSMHFTQIVKDYEKYKEGEEVERANLSIYW